MFQENKTDNDESHSCLVLLCSISNFALQLDFDSFRFLHGSLDQNSYLRQWMQRFKCPLTPGDIWKSFFVLVQGQICLTLNIKGQKQVTILNLFTWDSFLFSQSLQVLLKYKPRRMELNILCYTLLCSTIKTPNPYCKMHVQFT